MAEKELLIEALKNDEITTEHLNRCSAFPSLPPTGDYDANILVIAEFCNNLNHFYQDILDGVPVLRYALKAGQQNAALLAIAVSGLEQKDPEEE